MSMLITKQLAACEERLNRCSKLGIMGKELGRAELHDIWRGSFYFEESRDRLVPDQKTLKTLVMLRLPDEAALLSQGEESLVQRLLFSEGETELISWEEITYAESLVKRLWCTVRVESSAEHAVLKLENELVEPLISAMGTERYAAVRERLFSLDATLHGLLYLAGFLYADVPVTHFLRDVIKREDETARLLLLRSLSAAYDFCFDQNGDMLFLHPGLAEPEKLIACLSASAVPEVALTRDMLLCGMNEMLPEEASVCELMKGLLSGALRPEYEADEAVNDLKIMFKQGASYEETRLVAEDMLSVLPTEQMLDVLNRMESEITRWIGAPTARLN